MTPNGFLNERIYSRNSPALRYRTEYSRPDDDVNSIISKIEIRIYNAEFTIEVFIKDEENRKKLSDMFSLTWTATISSDYRS